MIMCFTIGLKDTARFQSSGYAHDLYSCQHPALRLFMYLNVISMTGFDFGYMTIEKKKPETMSLAFKFDGGRYKIRTCDPIRVKDMLYP